jgi:type VI secretion system secreted protein VgrG
MPTPKDGSRPLTLSEINMVRPIFRNAIRYDKVKVHNRKYAFFQPSNGAITPNGEIYFAPMVFQEDFHKFSAELQHFFIHEMVHVWQYQMGYPVKAQGIASALGYGYDYTLKPGMKLSNFPMEGQANIIADYAMYVLYGTPKHYSGKRYKKPASSLTDLQAVLEKFIINPLDKSNLPSFANPICDNEPNSIQC